MTQRINTQVAIIGAGPSGLLLGQLLYNAGIDHIIVERRSQEYVLGRIRAGMLEQRTVEALREAGAGERLDRVGLRQTGYNLIWDDRSLRIDFGLAGKSAVVYGQTEVTRDLVDARAATGGITYYEVDNTQVHDIDSTSPRVTFDHEGISYDVKCQFIAGCDGYHGITRLSIPSPRLSVYEHTYPFGWLGILADVPPVSKEVVWQNHENGFLMCSLRSLTRSRYYLQVPADEDINNWNVDRFWEEFESRLPPHLASNLTTGPALEMSIAPLRSFVAEPMQYGRLFLLGDAAHVVPPTGAKGLNMAVADAKELADSLRQYFQHNDERLLSQYSATALDRVWKAVRFSWWMTRLMHKFTDDKFERKIQLAELEYMKQSIAAQTTVAENFCGLD